MRVLVTGASGFAGGYIARKLASHGFKVFAVTRRGEATLQNYAREEATGRLSVFKVDLTNAPQLPHVDFIVHAAATSIWSGITVDQMLSDNVLATQKIVEHALRTDAKGFIFFSSLSVLGNIAVPVVNEQTPSINPDAYGLTKLLGERLLADAADRLTSLSIRLPAVIGPGSKRNWLSECYRKLKAGEPLTFVNPATLFNNACHIADLTEMIIQWLSDPKDGAQMVVVGASQEIMIRDVVGQLAKSLKTRSNIQVGDSKLRSFLIDSSYAQTNFNYAPMAVRDMIDRFVRDNS
ncbi:MAG: NAD(P)-dependent oxidoreductase [Paracoccaceae bacterium]